jgi:hypothetical protein
MPRSPDRVAHVVQAVEHRHEVEPFPGYEAAGECSNRTRSVTLASSARLRAVSIDPSW